MKWERQWDFCTLDHRLFVSLEKRQHSQCLRVKVTGVLWSSHPDLWLAAQRSTWLGSDSLAHVLCLFWVSPPSMPWGISRPTWEEESLALGRDSGKDWREESRGSCFSSLAAGSWVEKGVSANIFAAVWSLRYLPHVVKATCAGLPWAIGRGFPKILLHISSVPRRRLGEGFPFPSGSFLWNSSFLNF
jgi:hypothetical protein